MRKADKMLCVKTLGSLVKKWREASGLSQPELARRVGHGVKYQNIQQLENGGAKQPRYIAALARAMGTTADDLLALKSPPPLIPGAAGNTVEAEPAENVLALMDATPLIVAVSMIAEAMRQTDEVGRQTVAALLSRLATKPEEQQRIGSAIRTLVGDVEFKMVRDELAHGMIASGDARVQHLAERLEAITDPARRTAALAAADGAVEEALRTTSQARQSQAAEASAPDTAKPSRKRERTRGTHS